MNILCNHFAVEKNYKVLPDVAGEFSTEDIFSILAMKWRQLMLPSLAGACWQMKPPDVCCWNQITGFLASHPLYFPASESEVYKEKLGHTKSNLAA